MGLLLASRSMHFNSNPLQVDLSQNHGPKREEKGKDREGGGAAGIGGKWGVKRTIV